MDSLTQSVFIATSLDGFIARKNGDIDWLTGREDGPEGDEAEPYGYEAFINSIDAIVMGRNSYEKVLTFDKWYYTKKVFVLTNRPLDIPAHLSGKVEGTSGQPKEVVEELADKGFHHLYVDGGKTIQQFLNAGFIQEMTITRIPVLIGEGIPLFGPVIHDIQLEHIDTKTFESGFVQSKYKVNHK